MLPTNIHLHDELIRPRPFQKSSTQYYLSPYLQLAFLASLQRRILLTEKHCWLVLN